MNTIFGSAPDWVVNAQKDEDARIARHSRDCYDAWECQSCGCLKRENVACPGHAGNPAHMAALKEREIALLERIAAAQERSA